MNRKIVFNDPLAGSNLDRLKFLYLYYDNVEIVDYRPIFEKISTLTQDMGFLNEEFERVMPSLLRKYGNKDRNQMAMAKRAFRNKLLSELGPVWKYIDDVIQCHISASKYYEVLELEGVLHISREIKAPPDVKNILKIKAYSDDLKSQVSKDIYEKSRVLSRKIFGAAWTEGLRPPDVIEGVKEIVPAVFMMIAVTYAAGSLFKSLNGDEVYSNEDSLIDILGSLSNHRNPAPTRMADNVVSTEVPYIFNASFDDIREIKEKTKDLREEFRVYMDSFVSDLRNEPWDKELLNELELKKEKEVVPVIYRLEREYKQRWKDISGKAKRVAGVGAGVAAVVVDLKLNWSIGEILLASALGGMGSLLPDSAKSDKTAEENGLSYIVRLKREFS